jgi:hypothetical protein
MILTPNITGYSDSTILKIYKNRLMVLRSVYRENIFEILRMDNGHNIKEYINIDNDIVYKNLFKIEIEEMDDDEYDEKYGDIDQEEYDEKLVNEFIDELCLNILNKINIEEQNYTINKDDNKGPEIFDDICGGYKYDCDYQYGDACVVWYVLETGNIILHNWGDVQSVLVYDTNVISQSSSPSI